MTDRRTTLLLDRLRAIAARKDRFSYDVRGDSYVYSDFVAPYRLENSKGEPTTELTAALEHALVNDGVVTGVKDPATGRTLYTSCRLYTDAGNALRFAKEQGQEWVYNWNRSERVEVTRTPERVPTAGAPL